MGEKIGVPSGRDARSDEGHTPTPWGWYAEDFSMAILCGETNGHPDPFEKHVTTITMCQSCHDAAKADKRDHWEWGDCYTGKAADAAFIVRACNNHHELAEALRRVDHTLTIHGKVDADTDLHSFIRAALSKLETTPKP